MSVAPRPHITGVPGYISATSLSMSGSPGASHFGGKLSSTGTVSRCPARITRFLRPRSVDATIVSPSRCTCRCG